MSSDFNRILRHALNHLYDPEILRHNPLKDLLLSSGEADTTLELASFLKKNIESLKPAPSLPANAPEWRSYELLFYRYVQRAKQTDLAHQFACSVRQLRRDQVRALTYLAEHLLKQAGLTEQDLGELSDYTQSLDEGQAVVFASEFQAVREESGEERADLFAELAVAISIIRPILAAYQVRLDITPCDAPLLARIPAAVLRQVFLILLSGLAHARPFNRVSFECVQASQELHLNFHAIGPQASNWDAESFQDVVTMLRLAGGTFGFTEEADDLTIGVTLPLLTPINVLAIDDNNDMLQLMERYAAGSPYHILPCDDPRRALEMIHVHHPQFIILDVMMSKLDGWQVLRQIRADPTSAEIPVIICTIFEQGELAKSLGATDYLRKPISQEGFLKMLDRHYAR